MDPMNTIEEKMANQSIGTGGDDDDDVITPWEVTSKSATGVNYDKIVMKFGSELITDDLLKKFEEATSTKPHYFLTRRIFFSHRDVENILKLHKEKKPIYLYTGRGPSSSAMHVGHLLPFIMTSWLQKVFKCPVVIQLTDDEKWACNPDKVSQEDARRYAHENTKDIIACGFDPSMTLIFNNLGVISHEINLPHLMPFAWDVGIKTTQNKLRAIFGFTGEDNGAKYFFPYVQAAPSFSGAFANVFNLKKGDKPMACLIPCGIDQDPFFRLTRDVAQRLNHPKPALLHSKFFPALQGPQSKMSASNDLSAIFLTDTPNQIKNKINKYAFTGGGATVEEHRAKGGNCDIDIPFQYLRYFMEDDEELESIKRRYSSGEMLSGEIKKIAIEVVQKLVAQHQANRSQVTEGLIKKFMSAEPFPRQSRME